MPCTCLALAMLVLIVGNDATFRWMNGWSRFTGEAVWANVTTLGNGLLAAAMLLPFLGRRPRLLWSALLCGLLLALVLGPVKQLAAVGRPSAVLPSDSMHVIGRLLRRRAFPSGHAATIFAFAGLLLTTAGVLAITRWGPSWREVPLPIAVAALGLGLGLLGWRRLLGGSPGPCSGSGAPA